jgi:hypothetical protein
MNIKCFKIVYWKDMGDLFHNFIQWVWTRIVSRWPAQKISLLMTCPVIITQTEKQSGTVHHSEKYKSKWTILNMGAIRWFRWVSMFCSTIDTCPVSVFRGVRVTRSLVLRVDFVDSCCRKCLIENSITFFDTTIW